MTPSNYILHLPKWYPNVEDELEGIFVQRHIAASSIEFEHKVVFVKVSKFRNLNKPFQCQRKSAEGIDEFYAYYRDRFTGISLLDKLIKLILYYYLSFILIKACFKEFGLPRLVHVHVLMRSSLMAYLISNFYKIPYVITEHNTMYHVKEPLNKLIIKNIVRKFIVRRSSAVVAVSSNLVEAMKACGLENKNYNVVFNSVNTDQFYFQKKENGTDFRFLHVSEFKDYHKNISGIIKVFRRVALERPNVYLDLVGYGEDFELIKTLITNLELAGRVELKGKLKGNELASQYQTSDFFVLFSHKENMPCVLAEALCCGLPVLSSNVGGISEIINDLNGILVDASNEEQLYQAMEFCINNKTKFDRKVISESAFSQFSQTTIGDQFLQLYRKIT